MTRQVFFSFKFREDVFRVNQIRNMNQFDVTNQIYDKADYEKVMRETDASIKRWIDHQLAGASVTCVLIGTNTFESKWVKYEIEKSIEIGKGLLGIHIHNIKNQDGVRSSKGRSPFNIFNTYAVYDPVDYSYYANNEVYSVIKNNLSHWVDKAAKQAGR